MLFFLSVTPLDTVNACSNTEEEMCGEKMIAGSVVYSLEWYEYMD